MLHAGVELRLLVHVVVDIVVVVIVVVVVRASRHRGAGERLARLTGDGVGSCRGRFKTSILLK